ncbi:MAG TPA: GNAT family N-acetyltransferase [Acidimicrobiales bacterium]|nr:GNAT family N-acetyltransferase [Acidimicrobiales bacterium]
MKVTVCRPQELGCTELQRWDDLGQRAPGTRHPFLSARFAVLAGAVRSDARVAVLEQDGRTVGFWPFSVGRSRIARTIAPGYCNYEGLVHEAGLVWDWRSVIDQCGLSGCEFGGLAQHQAPAVGTTPTATSVMDLGAGWDAYLSHARAAHKNYFRQVLRCQRRMAREHEVSYREDDPSEEALAWLMDLKSRQCRERGWRDVFKEGWARDLTRKAATTKDQGLTGLVSTIRLDGEVVTAQLNLRTGSTQVPWFICFDPRYASLKPGVVAFLYTGEDAARAGVDRIDLGRGAESFKRFWANDHDHLAQGFVGTGGVPSGMALLARAPGAASRLLQRHPQGEQAVERAIQRTRRVGYRVGRPRGTAAGAAPAATDPHP